MTKKRKYTKITIKASQVLRAMDSVADKFDDWQAQYLEVTLIPKVYKRWRELNGERYPEVVIMRHDGIPHRGFSPDENRAIGDARGWAKFAGYTLWFHITDPSEGLGYAWNDVRDNWYGHSPANCWNGVTREMRHRFVEALVQAVSAYRKGDEPHYSIWDDLSDAGVELVNDLAQGQQDELPL